MCIFLDILCSIIRIKKKITYNFGGVISMLFYQLRVPCTFNKDGRMSKAYETSRDSFYNELDEINETLKYVSYEKRFI